MTATSDAGSTPEAVPIAVGWPPHDQTVRLARGAYLRVQVDQARADVGAGRVFATRAAADQAEEDDLTVLPARGILTVEHEGRTYEISTFQRSTRSVATPIVVGSGARFQVVEIGGRKRPGRRKEAVVEEVYYVRISFEDGAEPDGTAVRSHALLADAVADVQGALRLPRSRGTHQVVVISPDGTEILDVTIDVRRPLSESPPGQVVPGRITVPADVLVAARAFEDVLPGRFALGVVPAAKPTRRLGTESTR